MMIIYVLLKIIWVLITAGVLLFVAGSSYTPTTTSSDSTQSSSDLYHQLKTQIDQEIRKNEHADVRTAVSVIDLHNNETIVGHNQDEQHFSASINKNPLALLILEDLRRGTLTLDQTLSWTETERELSGGFGVYDQPGAPLEATVEEMLFDMLNHSGNTVARAFVAQALGGAQTVNKRWAQLPELENTRLQPLDNGTFYFGDTTSRDSLWALTELFAIDDTYSALVKDMMSDNMFDFMGVRSQLSSSDDHLVLINKIGIIDVPPNDTDGNNRHDTGIILNAKTGKMYGYSFLTTSPSGYPEDGNTYAATERAEQSLKDMGALLLQALD